MQRNRAYGADRAEFISGFLGFVAVAIIPVALAIVCAGCCVSGAEEQTQAEEPPEAVTMIDTSDSWEMHTLGLPTKSDIMAYHMYGRWGYARYEGEEQVHTMHIWEDVPGSIEAWDELYGIDQDNGAFNYPKE